MILGGNRLPVIENIKKNILDNELNKKVEIDDPVLTQEEIMKVIDKFYKNKKNKLIYSIRNRRAKNTLNSVYFKEKKRIKLEGLNNIKKLNLNNGAIITCNHFNQLDSFCAKKLADKLNKKLYMVIEDTNLMLPGSLGFLMNYLDVIPINKSPNYISHVFLPELKKILDAGHLVLIYPEEEMWFNYRKPRPCKRGAYQFASQLNVPIISCFVEMIDTNYKNTDDFNYVNCIVHILKPIIPDKNKSDRCNSIHMANIDYIQKKEAYRKAYGKKLDYTFDYSDIAGLVKKN